MGSIGFLLVVLVAIINLSLGLIVYFKNPKSATHRLITVLTIIFASWSIFNYFSLNSLSEETTLLWIRMVMVATAPLGPTICLLLIAFPNSVLPNKKLVYLLAEASLIVCILALTPFVFSDVSMKNGIEPKPNIGILLYVLLFFGSLIYGLWVTFHKYKKASGRSKLQFKYLFIGVILTFALQIFTNFVAVVFFKFSGLVILGPSFSLIFISLISYAIVKHRLLDIRLAVRKSIAQIFITSIVLSIFLFIFYIYSIYSNYPFSVNIVLLFLISSVVVSLLYDTISFGVRKLTDKYLFSGVYSGSDLLHKLSLALNTTMGFENVLKNIYEILNANIHVNSVTFAIRLQGRQNLPNLLSQSGEYAIYKYGQGARNLTMLSILSEVLQKYDNSLFIDEIRDLNGASEDLSKLKEWMVENQVGMILPLKIKNEVIGAIILGEKMSGEAFTSEDVNVLETFALQAAIGIENILLFMHSRDFGERLKVEVEQATSELKQKNKNLEVLRKMDAIITTTLNLKEMCQKIVDAVSWELGYDGAFVSLVDKKQNLLVPAAVSHTPNIKKALELLPKKLEELVVPLTNEKSMAVQALTIKGKILSTSLPDVFAPALPRSISSEMQQIIGTKGLIVYPIISKDNPIGVLTLAMHVSPHDLTPAEHNILDAFMEEVGIALENAYLYEQTSTANQALEVSNQKLIELDQMKDEFVSVASHELRTPMTAINGYVWMLLNGKGGSLAPKQKEYLERVAQSTQRLINLVNDMLTISRVEGGRTKIELSNFDVVELSKTVIDELQIKADEKKIKLLLESEDKMMVYADNDKVHEVLLNLIGNALKFTEHGSITTTILDRGDKISVSVHDTGRGIATEDMPKLFTKFGRLDNSYATVAQTTGTGLGLFICKKYIEAMNGTISASSELGSGSTFTFILPKKQD